MAPRRAVIVEVGAFDFSRMLGPQPMRSVDSDWPADAEIIDARWDPDRACLMLYVQSMSFDEVPEGAIAPPRWDPTFTEHRLAPELLNLVEAFRDDPVRKP